MRKGVDALTLNAHEARAIARVRAALDLRAVAAGDGAHGDMSVHRPLEFVEVHAVEHDPDGMISTRLLFIDAEGFVLEVASEFIPRDRCRYGNLVPAEDFGEDVTLRGSDDGALLGRLVRLAEDQAGWLGEGGPAERQDMREILDELDRRRDDR